MASEVVKYSQEELMGAIAAHQEINRQIEAQWTICEKITKIFVKVIVLALAVFLGGLVGGLVGTLIPIPIYGTALGAAFGAAIFFTAAFAILDKFDNYMQQRAIARIKGFTPN